MAERNEEPFLSVICPIANMAGRLDNLQTWLMEICDLDCEVFLIHDIQDTETGSQLRKIVESMGNKSIRLSEGKFGSAGAARNSVLGQCKGMWICFWDSDDLPSAKAVYSNLKDEFDIVIGEFEFVYPDGAKKKVQNPKGGEKVTGFVSHHPGIWRFAFKRSKFQDIRFPTFRLGEDQGYLAQIPWSELRIGLVDQSFYSYFVGNDFQTTAKSKPRDSIVDSVSFLINLQIQNRGDNALIQRFIARQSLTLLKTRKLTLIISLIRTIFKLSRHPKLFVGQMWTFVLVTLNILGVS